MSPAHDSSSLALCLHEEAETRMLGHAVDAPSRGHKKIIIRTVDTDNVVPAVYVVQQLGVDELWQNFGVGKHRKYITSHLLTQAIGNLNICLPFDTTSSFLGHGKRSAWEALNNYALLWKSPLQLVETALNVSSQYCMTGQALVHTLTWLDNIYLRRSVNQWKDFHLCRRHCINIF